MDEAVVSGFLFAIGRRVPVASGEAERDADVVVISRVEGCAAYDVSVTPRRDMAPVKTTLPIGAMENS